MLAPLLALVLAQGVQYQPGSEMVPSLLEANSAAVLDMRFDACGTTPTIKKGGPLTVSRAASQTYVCADGILRTAASNALPITESGAQIFGAGQNRLSHSEDIVTGISPTSPWTMNNSGTPAPTCSTYSGTDPYGNTSTISRLSIPSIAAGQYSQFQQQVTSLVSGTYRWSIWLRKVSGTSATCRVRMWSAAHVAPLDCAVTSQWKLFSASGNCTAGYANLVIGSDGSNATQSDIVVDVWGAQLTAGDTLYPYQPTTTAPVSWPATMVRAANPMTTAQEANLCFTAKAAVPSWTPTPTNWLMRIAGTDEWDSVGLYLNSGTLRMETTDGSADYRRAAYSPSGLTAGSAHTITGCVANKTTNSLAIDSAGVASTLSGIGQGVTNAEVFVFLGNYNNSGHLNGFLSSAKICKSANPSACK